jgi:L-lactate dehydrogenase complex protein LldG
LHEHFSELCLARKWTKIYCSEEKFLPLIQQKFWTDDIVTCDASVTACECLIARTGSIVLSSVNSGRLTSVYAPVHICIAYTSQLLYDIKDGLMELKKKYGENLPSMISFATGPSRTADIEKTLVVGVHGPREVYLFLIDDQP